MGLPPLFSRNDATDKRIKSELRLVFSNILKEDNKSKKRQLNVVKINMLRTLKGKPIVRFRTKKILDEFESFLNVFEK